MPSSGTDLLLEDGRVTIGYLVEDGPVAMGYKKGVDIKGESYLRTGTILNGGYQLAVDAFTAAIRLDLCDASAYGNHGAAYDNLAKRYWP